MPSKQPVDLSQALASFADVYSPRVVGRVNDYDVKVAHVKGDHVLLGARTASRSRP